MEKAIILAASAIGAGLAMIAGIGPVLVRDMQLVKVQRQLEDSQKHNLISLELCYLEQRLLSQQVSMV